MLKILAASTDEKKFKTTPPVKMAISSGEEKEHADKNLNMTEKVVAQLEIVPPDETVNKGNKNESADQTSRG